MNSTYLNAKEIASEVLGLAVGEITLATRFLTNEARAAVWLRVKKLVPDVEVRTAFHTVEEVAQYLTRRVKS